jgi:hypothetical protein
MNYRNLVCIGCGYSWDSRSIKPRCPKCSKRRFNEREVEIPEYKETRSKKIINDIKKIRIEKEVSETLESVEVVPQIEEVKEIKQEVIYSCSECSFDVLRTDIYCGSCCTRLLWEHLEEFNNGGD